MLESDWESFVSLFDWLSPPLRLPSGASQCTSAKLPNLAYSPKLILKISRSFKLARVSSRESFFLKVNSASG